MPKRSSTFMVELPELREFLRCPKRAQFHRRSNVKPEPDAMEVFTSILRRTLVTVCIRDMESVPIDLDSAMVEIHRKIETNGVFKSRSKRNVKRLEATALKTVAAFFGVIAKGRVLMPDYPFEISGLQGTIDFMVRLEDRVLMVWLRGSKEPFLLNDLPLVAGVYQVVGRDRLISQGLKIEVVEITLEGEVHRYKAATDPRALRKEVIDLVAACALRPSWRVINPHCGRCPYLQPCRGQHGRQ